MHDNPLSLTPVARRRGHAHSLDFRDIPTSWKVSEFDLLSSSSTPSPAPQHFTFTLRTPPAPWLQVHAIPHPIFPHVSHSMEQLPLRMGCHEDHHISTSQVPDLIITFSSLPPSPPSHFYLYHLPLGETMDWEGYWCPTGQGAPNYSPWAKSAFVTKDGLEPSHIHLSPCYLCGFRATMVKLSSCDRDHSGLKILKGLQSSTERAG